MEKRMPLVENPSLFSNVRDWLEILYYVSGIVMMLLIGFGLWQLKLTKDQIETSKNIFKTQSRRAAVEAAVIECRNYSEKIVQDSIALDKFCNDNSISLFDDIIFEKTENGFTVDPKNINKDDVKKLAGAEDIINRIINGLESYALFFLSGVADEEIAFHVNAKSFIEQSEKMFKIYPVCNMTDDDFEPVKALYSMWYKKHEANKSIKVAHKSTCGLGLGK